jgi:hypothetical protein
VLWQRNCWLGYPGLTLTVTDYDALTILDIGGGDLQQTDITLKPAYRMSSERRGDGTIDIARGLKQLLPKAKFNDVTAQYALITRQALISGKMQTIEKEAARTGPLAPPAAPAPADTPQAPPSVRKPRPVETMHRDSVLNHVRPRRLPRRTSAMRLV